MKICMLGSGALGSSLGRVLAEAGEDIYLVDQWADHIDAINANGLKVRVDGVDKFVKVKAETDPNEIGIVDLVIVLVKSFHTKSAVQKAKSIIGENTVVLSLQNGMGNEDAIAEVVGKEKVIGGRTYAGGVMLAPGHIISGTIGKYTYIGELDGSMTERIKNVADTFNNAGLLTEIDENILGMMWDKLLINAATGALSGLTRLPYGGLYSVQECMDCALEVVSEGIAVAKASGVELSVEDPEKIWFKASEGLPAEFKASILQSVEKFSQTEIDFINGAIVRQGAKVGIPTPVNKTLVAAIKGLELWMEKYAVNKTLA